MWYYVCMMPPAPYPNLQLYNRLFKTRTLMWQAWQYNLDGFLFWNVNYYYHGSYGMGFNGWGDGWLVYYNEEAGKWYGSIRLENLLDGQEDFEMIWLVNESLQYLRDNPGLIAESSINRMQDNVNSWIDSVAKDRLDYAQSALAIYQAIINIGDLLDQLCDSVPFSDFAEQPWSILRV